MNLAAPGPNPGSQSCTMPGDCHSVFSYPMFRDLQRARTAFSGIAAHRPFGANLSFRGQTFAGRGLLVSGSYFPVLGLQPAAGRLLSPGDDDAIGAHFVTVLSYAYWQRRFDGDPGVIGQPLAVNGQPMTIVGVAPQGFDGTTLGLEPQVFVPISMRGQMVPGWNQFDNRRSYWAYLFARLEPGVSIEQARTAVNVPYHAIINDVEASLQTGMSDETMKRFRAKTVTVTEGWRGQSNLHRDAWTPLLFLLGITGVVVLIACANIANLLLARAATRTTEMAVRLSLGASRRQLVAQLLAESCLLAVLGGAAGLLVARWTLGLMASLLPAEQAIVVPAGLDPRALVFTAALALATGLLFGLFPALHSTRPDLAITLKNQAGQPGGGRGAARFRTALATSQIALSMALLIAAGLLTRSLLNVAARGPRPEDRPPRDLQRVAVAERLQAGAVARPLRARRGRDLGRPRRHGHHRVHGARAHRGELGQRRDRRGVPRRPRRGHELALQRGGAGLLPDDGHPGPVRPRLHRGRHARRPQGGHRQRGVREEVQPGARRPSASACGSAAAAATSTSRSSAWCGTPATTT